MKQESILNKHKKTGITVERGLYDDNFQKRLIKILIEEKDKFKNDIQYINQNAFTNSTYKIISGLIKDYTLKYEYIPSYETLNSLILARVSDDMDLQLAQATIKEIQELNKDGLEWVKQESIEFFKRQELIKFFNQQLSDLKFGIDITTKDLSREILEILSIGTHDTVFTGVYDDFDETFSPEDTVRIPTLCPDIDNYLQGGIIKRNLVLVAASSGVGKTTVSTALAHSAAISGFKALQIFFEDNVPAIRRKHFGRVTEIEARLINTAEYAQTAKDIATNYEHKELIKENLKLSRFRNGEVTPVMLKQHIDNLVNTGFSPDMILIDYFECMANPTNRNIQNEWKLETQKMRELENLCEDLGAVVVVFTQGTKQSAEGMLLTLDKIGGSAGKYQVSHMIMTLNRTHTDADNNRAELYIPKNREGKSGKIFSLHLNNGIPKLEVDGVYESVDALHEVQRTQANNIPSPENEEKIERINTARILEKLFNKENNYQE